MVQVIWRKNLKYSFILSKIEVQELNFLALFFVVSNIIRIFAGRAGRTRSVEEALCSNLRVRT